MGKDDEEFFNKLISIFQVEAAEHLNALSNGLLELEKELPEDRYKQVVEDIFREAHSLKGAARSVNKKNIQEICQSLENVLAILKQKQIQISSELFDSLHQTIDILTKGLIAELDIDTVTATTRQLAAAIEKMKLEPSTVPQFKVAEVVESNLEPKSSLDKTIRVSLQKLNLLFQEIEETLMIKLFFNQQLSDLRHLSSHLGNLDIKAAKELINKLIKNADQNSNFIHSMVDTLLEDAKKILMQPTGTLFEAIPLMVRDIARDLGKEVRVEMMGGDIEVDRRVLEEIKDPIIHIIRNAIDHGIETPNERAKKNKPPFGTIKIVSSESEGNRVSIAISDDGNGFDVEKLKQKAVQKGFISAKDAEEMPNEKAYMLAFHSDISTSPIITELSGRGLGLGIVSEKVDKLGGQVRIESTPNQGAIFTLILPLTLATFRGVHITVSDQDFILPTHNIKRVLRIHSNEIKRAENKETIVIEDQPYSFVHLTELLGMTKKKLDVDASPYFFALIVKAAEQTMVFGADYVHSECEILVKGLGSQCVRAKNIMAATIMEKGNIIPVLNPSDLIKSTIKGDIIAVSQASPNKKQAAKKSILLAEDSLTTRLLLKNILTTAAYDVKTAVDGAEAFETLQTQSFDLLLTDVEMPRMNGFSLTEKVRAIDKFKNLPIIICSALGSREDRERGIELGANAYIDKNTFNQQSLISIVQKLI